MAVMVPTLLWTSMQRATTSAAARLKTWNLSSAAYLLHSSSSRSRGQHQYRNRHNPRGRHQHRSRDRPPCINTTPHHRPPPHRIITTITTTHIIHIPGKQQSAIHYREQGLSQDLETGCPKLAIVQFWGVQFFKGDLNVFG